MGGLGVAEELADSLVGAGSGNVGSASHISQLGESDGRECTGKRDIADNGRKAWETVDRGQLGVVGQLQTTTDLSEGREAQIVKLGAVNEGNGAAGLGQVGCGKALEVVGVEANGTRNVRERWHGDGADVSERQVGSSLEVGELDVQVHAIGREGEACGNIGQAVDIDGFQVLVVVDVHGANLRQFDTGQVGETSVGDVDLVGLGHTAVEVESLESWEGNPSDAVDAVERAELQSAEDGQAVQIEDATNSSKLIGTDLSQLSGIVHSQITSNALYAVKRKLSANRGVDDDVSLVCLAGCEGCCIVLASDCEI